MQSLCEALGAQKERTCMVVVLHYCCSSSCTSAQAGEILLDYSINLHVGEVFGMLEEHQQIDISSLTTAEKLHSFCQRASMSTKGLWWYVLSTPLRTSRVLQMLSSAGPWGRTCQPSRSEAPGLVGCTSSDWCSATNAGNGSGWIQWNLYWGASSFP